VDNFLLLFFGVSLPVNPERYIGTGFKTDGLTSSDSLTVFYYL
jgi:hypothetical protein